MSSGTGQQCSEWLEIEGGRAWHPLPVTVPRVSEEPWNCRSQDATASATCERARNGSADSRRHDACPQLSAEPSGIGVQNLENLLNVQ